MKKRKIIKVFACILAAAIPITAAILAFAETNASVTEPYSSLVKYDSPDINELSGMGEEPEDISVSAESKYMEKAWYEYVTYSDKAIASYRLNDNYRLLFYDPYTYTNAMVMDVQFDAAANDFDTMSSYTISKTSAKSIHTCVSSTETDTKAIQESGRDISHITVTNDGTLKTIYNHEIKDETSGTVKEYTNYEYIKKDTTSTEHTSSTNTTLISETGFKITTTGLGSEATETITIQGDQSTSDSTSRGEEWLTNKTTNTTEYSPDYKTTTKYTGYDTVEDNTTSTTDGWTELSARVTKTLGSSRSTSNSWSEEESVTVTKTYAATHFASDGVTPLPWAIVHYEVQMPLKVCMQVKHGGEWITISTAYSMLTTVKGTCRAWMQNGQTYYEDWGSGEPVMATDFWAQFLTKDKIMDFYKDKLYPAGGLN